MADTVEHKLASKQLRTLRKVNEPLHLLSRARKKILEESPLEVFFDPSFLLRVGLNRPEEELKRLGQGVKQKLQLFGLRTVRGIVELCSLDILAHIPTMGVTSIVFLLDLLTAFDLKLSDKQFKFGETFDRSRGNELADRLGLPQFAD